MLCQAIAVGLLTVRNTEAKSDFVFNIDHVLVVLDILEHFLLRGEHLPFKVKLEAILLLVEGHPHL